MRRLIGLKMAVHTDQPHVQRVAVRKCTQTHKRGHHRCVQFLGKSNQIFTHFGENGAAANINQRFPGVSQQFQCPIYARLLGHLKRLNLHFRFRHISTGGRSYILGNIYQNRTFAPGLCNAERPAQRGRQLLHRLHLEVVLGNGHGNTANIYLLEAVSPQAGGGIVAGNGNHRHRIHISRGNTGHQIGGAGAGGGKAHAHLAGSAGITVCRVGRALLMGSQNMLKGVTIFIKLVKNIQDRTAGITKDSIYALFFQDFKNDLRAIEFH